MSISSVTSEALQLKLRELLPSQQGFSTDISASDTIIPVIDLTDAAGGSTVGVNLQTALAFGSQTTYEVEGATTTVANTTGFYRVFGSMTVKDNGSAREAEIRLSNGGVDKAIYGYDNNGFLTTSRFDFEHDDFVVFLATGDSLVMHCNDTGIQLKGSVRQIADANGTLTNPSGFTPQ